MDGQNIKSYTDMCDIYLPNWRKNGEPIYPSRSMTNLCRMCGVIVYLCSPEGSSLKDQPKYARSAYIDNETGSVFLGNIRSSFGTTCLRNFNTHYLSQASRRRIHFVAFWSFTEERDGCFLRTVCVCLETIKSIRLWIEKNEENGVVSVNPGYSHSILMCRALCDGRRYDVIKYSV